MISHYFLAHCTPAAVADLSRTLHSCTWCHVQYSIVPTLRRDSQNLRRNLPLYSVLCNAHWRSSSLVKNLERQWWNGWCLTWHLAIPVTSQVPFFLPVSAIDVSFGEGYRFQMAIWSLEAFSGRPTQGEKERSFFLHIWRRGTSTGQMSSRHRFAQPRNQFQSFRKKSDIHTPILMVHYGRRDRQTERQ